MEFKSNKILEEVHPLNIIREIQKWPVLYSRDGSQRPTAGTHFRSRVWAEVARNLFQEWDQFDQQTQEQKHLNKKWRNLRDTFKRQLLLEKKMREGQKIKRKTYVYFEHMQFLLPYIEPAEQDSEVKPRLEEFFNKGAKRKVSKDTHITKKTRPMTHLLDDAPAASNFADVLDADRHFLLSLIPSFQTMAEDDKLTAKVEILKVIKNIKKKTVSKDGAPEPDSLTLEGDEEHLGQTKTEKRDQRQLHGGERMNRDVDTDDTSSD
ncbi:dorsal interacting protein 3 [Danaus plexippus plexippus]|uniref:Dorsal interacting protein 3 n=1 Tax=Danaus plexippus plexippus TaxID=278856 RepID=A0A212FBS8_DANPL|nr:uncharacterized protein LOC116774070 isoform X2 [Danaus plexippus plexippus]OWR51189.1 dorsal interacting protein 3 [Danaus plexippus plexippus]